jgi:hypothetical protein
MMAVDHVTLGTSSLEAGAGVVRGALGIDMPAGGKHPDMSTHNRVLNVGDSRFLELIAVDPDAPPTPHKRWFGLDDPDVLRRIGQSPRGVGWVVRTDELDGVVQRSPVDLGEAKRMSRGDRTWRLTVSASGEMPFAGLVPAFIEWSPGPHPSEGMRFLGPRLEAIELRHPQVDRLREVLHALGVLDLVSLLEAATIPSLAFRFRLSDGTLHTLGA